MQRPPLPRTPDRHLHVLAGLPRSGKSTWAQASGHPVVCPDGVRMALHGRRYLRATEPLVWALVQLFVRALFFGGHKHVVVDATNTTNDQREMWRCPTAWKTEFVHIQTPAEVCTARAKQGRDDALLSVIERMSAQWEEFQEGDTVTRVPYQGSAS